eukprot:sb/3467518/
MIVNSSDQTTIALIISHSLSVYLYLSISYQSLSLTLSPSLLPSLSLSPSLYLPLTLSPFFSFILHHHYHISHSLSLFLSLSLSPDSLYLSLAYIYFAPQIPNFNNNLLTTIQCSVSMKSILLLFVLLLIPVATRKERTQKDWDRIAREMEREELELEEKERQEEMARKPGIKFPGPGENIDPEQLMAQSKRGQPIMVFFNIRAPFCKTEKQTAVLLKQCAAALLNASIQVQSYPVGGCRAIFYVQDGQYAYQAKDYLLTRREVESVSIDQREFDNPVELTEEEMSNETEDRDEL